MKILLATDGSKYSKATIYEIANRPFPLKTEVCILAVYETTPIINTLEPMGASHDFYAQFDKNIGNNVKIAAQILENSKNTV